MSTIYHCKEMNTLVIDWMVVQGHGSCYGSLLDSMINNNPETVSIAIRPEAENSPLELIGDICQQAGIKTIVLLNLLAYMGIQRSENLVQKLHKTVGPNCQIYLGGDEEIVCGEMLGPNSEDGVPVIRTLGNYDIIKSTGCDPWVPIGINNSVISQEKKSLFTSLLSSLGVEDAIEIVLPGQTQHVPNSSWDPDWTIMVDLNNTTNDLLETIDERIHRLGCTSITFTGDVFRSNLWPQKNVLISWLDALHKQCPSISLAIQDSPQILDKSFLQELHGLGVNKFCVKLSPSYLSPQKTEIVSKMLAACIESKIVPSVCGNLVTKKDSREKVRKMWALCDKIGSDFIEMLGATLIEGTNGWCGELCSLLSQSPSLFFEYRCARKHTELAKKRPDIYGKLHPSILAFYRMRFEHARNWFLSELSNQYVFKREINTIQQVKQKVNIELTDISLGLLRMSGKSKQKAHISANTIPEEDYSDTAIIVVANNNEYNLRLCLHSIFLYTNHRYDLFVTDCSNFESVSMNIPKPGRFNYEHLPRQRLRSFATAWGINRAWQCNQYKYVLILDSNACALETDWLSEMIAELEQASDIGAMGLRLDQLDYDKHEGATYLLNYVLSPGWRQSMGLRIAKENKNFLQKLSAKGKSCFTELTGWIQLYRGDVLRRIGLPIVDDTRLKHVHWGSELSMRAAACGYKILDSSTARKKLHHFGKHYDSGIADVSYYLDEIGNIRDWLKENEQTILTELLRENKEESKMVQPSYYDWCHDISSSLAHNSR